MTPEEVPQVKGRSMLVKRLKPVLIEAVVRGYLAGSGWKEYQESQAVCGVKLPAGLVNSAKLPEPIYTPAAKAEMGDHDENITYERTVEMVGEELASKIRDTAIRIYKEAAEIALTKGMIIADTKFEFGLTEDGELVLMDEVLTPTARATGLWKAMKKRSRRASTLPATTSSLCVTGWSRPRLMASPGTRQRLHPVCLRK